MTTTNVRAVLFDWDGTLVDTAEASFRCYVRLFEEFGIPFDRETYARTYSPNWYQTFRMLDIPEERWPHADARWLAHFAEEQVALIDGARELIDELHARGFATGIVTSGSRGRVMRELDTHGFAFHECVFGCDVKEKKPHPEGLLLCLDRLKVTAKDAVYVGDSPEDVAMAKAAGVYAIAVPGGYPNREALLAAGADVVVSSLDDLRVILSEAKDLPS
ncbi:MAG TPA: HAD-IA family hydrolase [Thermoanaerobaculia bacterium]|jgi:HAD superfamily hydrolase (TIGR01509 family)